MGEKYIKEYIAEKIRKKYVEKETIINNYIKKIREDVMFKIVDRLRRRSQKYIKKTGLTNMELIGCSRDELKVYIENKFENGMSYDNYGEWELDHVRPLASYNLENVDEIIECFNYRNIQPLWKNNNRTKSSYYEKKYYRKS